MSSWKEGGAEGFICPYCLVSFASSNKLQTHFIDFHSNEGGDASVEDDVFTSREQQDACEPDSLGHVLKTVQLSKPCACDVCKDIVWTDASFCQLCSITLHIKCSDQITKTCTVSSSDQKESSLSSTPLRADAPPPAKGIAELVRRKVAKGRNRYVDETFDLDLTYITEKIIAMSYPGTGLESTYRNNVKDVAKMLKTKHQENYMIFNLSERSYDISRFNNQVLDFGWPDHLAPSLERLSTVCKSMKSWLDSDPLHVAVVHCKGGKGRTGCVIAAFMHYSEICQSPEAALDHFAMKRFYDDKLVGVTQPSQRRYVHYFADLLAGKISLHAAPLVLRHVIIHGVPNFDGKGGCRPFLKVYENMKLIHTSGLYVCSAEKERIKISLYGGLKMQGEILLKCFHKRSTGVESIFRTQFHHAVVTDLRMVLAKQDLDDAFREKRFSDNIKVELIFEQWTGQQIVLDGSAEEKANIRDSLLVEKTREGLAYLSLTADDKRNSYASIDESFAGRTGASGQGRGSLDVPNMIQFEGRERSSTSDSFKLDKLDPELIERVSAGEGELYTVVTKVNGVGSPAKSSNPPVPHPKPSKNVPIPPNRPQSTALLDLSSPHKSSHAAEREGEQQQNARKKIPPPKPQRPPHLGSPYYSEIDEVREGARQLEVNRDSHNTSGTAAESCFPSKYDEVPLEGKKLVLQPVAPRQSTSDNDMWMSIKWQTLPDKKENEFRRSTSSGALDAPEYTNLTEIAAGDTFVSETQRRHSFSEGKGSDSPRSITRKSVIPVSGNIVDMSSDIYTVPPDAEGEKEEDSDVYDVPPDADYVNYDASEMQHEYLNEQQIDEMLRNVPMPVERADTGRPAATPQQQQQNRQQQFSGPLAFMNMFSERFRNSKSNKPPSVIHSASIDEQEKNMPSFDVSTRQGKLQIGRGDYMSFSKDSWGGRQQPQATPSARPEAAGGGGVRPKPTPPKKPSPPKRHSPPVKKKPLPSMQSHSHIQSHPQTHQKLKASVSQPLDGASRDSEHRPDHSRLRVTDQEHRPRHNPPPKPAPYKPMFESTPPSVSQVRQLMGQWYHSSITRDAAAEMVKSMKPGGFIVRDSQTVHGGYALTIRVSEDLIREKRKISKDTIVTEEMCVTHFLIQPTPGGIKLQGWNECSFPTLAEFISKHCVEKLCLPCVLKLPDARSKDAGGRKRADMDHALVSGAACDLVSLGAVEVSGPGSDAIISDALRQLRALGILNLSIVNFKASKSSITITDTSNGILNKRNYPIHTITYCGVGPADMRWDFPHLEHAGGPLNLRNKPCFGVIHKPPDSSGYVCLMFAELDSSGPVANVVHYVRHVLGTSR